MWEQIRLWLENNNNRFRRHTQKQQQQHKFHYNKN